MAAILSRGRWVNKHTMSVTHQQVCYPYGGIIDVVAVVVGTSYLDFIGAYR